MGLLAGSFFMHFFKMMFLNIFISPNFDKCSALLKIQAQDKIDFINNIRNKVEKREDVNEKVPLEDETSRSTFS